MSARLRRSASLVKFTSTSRTSQGVITLRSLPPLGLPTTGSQCGMVYTDKVAPRMMSSRGRDTSQAMRWAMVGEGLLSICEIKIMPQTKNDAAT